MVTASRWHAWCTAQIMANAVVYSLGSINVDFQVRTERWPDPGETLLTTDFLRAAGGKAANRAYLARRLGQPAALLGRVGNDDLGKEAQAPLEALGVDTSGVYTTPEIATGVSMIVVRDNADKTILLSANANGKYSDADVKKIEQTLARSSIGSVLSVDLEVPEFIVSAALKAARDRGMSVVLDPSPAVNMRDNYYAYADWITPNHTEAARLAGMPVDNAETGWQVAQTFVDRGARGACVKLGDGGCVAIQNGERLKVNAKKVDVVDKTGAGDAFAGALAVAVLEQQSTHQALRFAVGASTLAVAAYGSQAAYPDRARLENFLRSEE